MPTAVYLEGSVGVISRSGTLVYETVDQLTRAGIGQSSSVGVGGDPIIGTTQAEALALFEADPDTAAVVLIGEIGGTAEQEAAAYVAQMSKPVTAFIAGATAPARPSHGPRRRDHRRQGGHRRREEGRPPRRRRHGHRLPLADRRDVSAAAPGRRPAVAIRALPWCTLVGPW